jgi:hypothetical protein
MKPAPLATKELKYMHYQTERMVRWYKPKEFEKKKKGHLFFFSSCPANTNPR